MPLPDPALAARRPLMEQLEGRRLLSAAVPVDGGFSATVNFQPDTLGPVESTRADFGRPFAVRGNGLEYGWSRNLDAAGDMIDSDSDRDLPGLSFGGQIGNGPEGEDQSVDQRFDTFAQVDPSDEWSIAVPNGNYVVAFVSGNPDFVGEYRDARLAWDVNGTPAMLAFPRTDYPWGEAVAYVEVTDGRLRLQADESSDENTLMWTRIVQIQPPPDYAEGETINWESTGLDAPTSRIEPGVVRQGNQLFVIGGFVEYYADVTRRVDILDLETLTWSQGAPLPEGAAESHAGVALGEVNGQIYWLGGQLGTSGEDSGAGTFTTTLNSYRYDIASDTWEQVFDAPTTAYAPGAVFLDGNLHFFGGSDASRIHPLEEHYVIDLAAYDADPGTEWDVAAFMPIPADHFATTVVDGKIYAIGGEYSHSYSYVPRRDVQIYDPATDSWSMGQPMPEGVSHHEGTSIEYEGKIYVLAGKKLANRGTTSVQSYNPMTDEWFTHNPIPLTRFGGIGFEREGRFYYLAGDDFNNQLTSGGVQGDIV